MSEPLVVESTHRTRVRPADRRSPVAELARTMVAGRIHRLIVTRRDNVVGIVTTLDLLRLLYEEP